MPRSEAKRKGDISSQDTTFGHARCSVRSKLHLQSRCKFWVTFPIFSLIYWLSNGSSDWLVDWVHRPASPKARLTIRAAQWQQLAKQKELGFQEDNIFLMETMNEDFGGSLRWEEQMKAKTPLITLPFGSSTRRCCADDPYRKVGFKFWSPNKQNGGWLRLQAYGWEMRIAIHWWKWCELGKGSDFSQVRPCTRPITHISKKIENPEGVLGPLVLQWLRPCAWFHVYHHALALSSFE